MKVEMIQWHDASAEASGEWKSADEVEDEDAVIVSVGWVVRETEKYVTLAMDLCTDGQTHTRARIPRGLIVQRTVLHETPA